MRHLLQRNPPDYCFVHEERKEGKKERDRLIETILTFFDPDHKYLQQRCDLMFFNSASVS